MHEKATAYFLTHYDLTFSARPHTHTHSHVHTHSPKKISHTHTHPRTRTWWSRWSIKTDTHTHTHKQIVFVFNTKWNKSSLLIQQQTRAIIRNRTLTMWRLHILPENSVKLYADCGCGQMLWACACVCAVCSSTHMFASYPNCVTNAHNVAYITHIVLTTNLRIIHSSFGHLR